jgi:hypothetical protein
VAWTVFTWSTPPRTSIDSAESPTTSFAFPFAVWSTFTVRAKRVVLKPLAPIDTMKSPGFKNANVYAPAELVLTEVNSSVATFLRDTIAPLITAPLGSVIVPCIPPVEIVVCEYNEMASPTTAIRMLAGALRNVKQWSPSAANMFSRDRRVNIAS